MAVDGARLLATRSREKRTRRRHRRITYTSDYSVWTIRCTCGQEAETPDRRATETWIRKHLEGVGLVKRDVRVVER